MKRSGTADLRPSQCTCASLVGQSDDGARDCGRRADASNAVRLGGRTDAEIESDIIQATTDEAIALVHVNETIARVNAIRLATGWEEPR
jgi:hypothetical protein